MDNSVQRGHGLKYLTGSVPPSFVGKDRELVNLSDIFVANKKRKANEELARDISKMGTFTEFMVELNPLASLGTLRVFPLYSIHLTLQSGIMSILHPLDKNLPLESWRKMIVSTFRSRQQQTFNKMWLSVTCNKSDPNRCYNFTYKYAYNKHNLTPYETIRADEYNIMPASTNRVDLNLATQTSNPPGLVSVYEFGQSATHFLEWIQSNYVLPLVYVGTDSAEDERVEIQLQICAKIEQFCPDEIQLLS